MIMVNLCAAMPDRQLAVHDVVYAPSQYLWEQLVNNARVYAYKRPVAISIVVDADRDDITSQHLPTCLRRWLGTVLRPTDDQAGLVRRPSSIAVAVEAFLYSLQALEGRSTPVARGLFERSIG